MSTVKQSPKSHVPKGKRQLNVYISLDTAELIKQVLERDGVSYSGQVERALKLYAESKGVRSTGASHARRGIL